MEEVYDVLILKGGGSASLTATIHAGRYNLKTLVGLFIVPSEWLQNGRFI